MKAAYIAIPVPQSVQEIPIAVKAWWSMPFTAKVIHLTIVVCIGSTFYRMF